MPVPPRSRSPLLPSSIPENALKTVPAHAPRAGYRQALLPDPLGDFPMLAAFIRFLEELIDVANFGRDLSK